MGYSVCRTHGRRTCDICDACPGCAEARANKGTKVKLHLDKCPVGWCPTLHVCPTCRKEKADRIKARHVNCAKYSAKFHMEQETRKEAAAAGLAVIKAGVCLPGHTRVYAWTTQGNFEVDRDAYDAGLQKADQVLDLTGAVRRHDERPAEVYHI